MRGLFKGAREQKCADNTAFTRESYAAAEKAAGPCRLYHGRREGRDASGPTRPIEAYGEEKAAAECGVGLPTLWTWRQSWQKPGRDPRDELPKPVLRTGCVLDMNDFEAGH